MQREPVTIVAIVEALLGLAVAFGLELTSEQLAALLAVAGVLGALIARRFAWSRASVQQLTGRTETQNLQVLKSRRLWPDQSVVDFTRDGD